MRRLLLVALSLPSLVANATENPALPAVLGELPTSGREHVAQRRAGSSAVYDALQEHLAYWKQVYGVNIEGAYVRRALRRIAMMPSIELGTLVPRGAQMVLEARIVGRKGKHSISVFPDEQRSVAVVHQHADGVIERVSGSVSNDPTRLRVTRNLVVGERVAAAGLARRLAAASGGAHELHSGDAVHLTTEVRRGASDAGTILEQTLCVTSREPRPGRQVVRPPGERAFYTTGDINLPLARFRKEETPRGGRFANRVLSNERVRAFQGMPPAQVLEELGVDRSTFR